MSKIGEVYEVYAVEPKRFFQLVAFDKTQLTSDVIGVFNYNGNFDTDKNDSFDRLFESGVDFFTHTTVKAGVKLNLWGKIGLASLIDTSDALFKGANYETGIPDIESNEADSYDRWDIWKINDERKFIGQDIEKYPSAVLGMVFPPNDVIYRIQHGEYSGPAYYGQKK